jgi:hypothetical protein
VVRRWVVGATPGQINMSQLHFHIGDLHSGISELMTTCACRSFRSATWSSRRSFTSWEILFLDMSLAFVVTHSDTGGWAEVDALERECCSGGGGYHYSLISSMGCNGSWSIPWSTCHIDMCIAACSGPVYRHTKSCWWWCFFGSGNGKGLAYLPTRV